MSPAETSSTTVKLDDGFHKDNTLALDTELSTSNFSGNSEEKTIQFYNSAGKELQEVLDLAIAIFEAKYPDWKVSQSPVGGYDQVRDKCRASLAAGSQPDLAFCYADHVADYIKTGKVVDMSDYINATGTLNGEVIGYSAEEVADFVSGYYSEGFATNFGSYDTYGYKSTDILTLPFVKSTEVLYYNATALKACGITNPDGTVKVPTTWDELWEQCETISDYYDEYACTPLGYDSEANWVITMCEQNGWGYTSAQDPHFLFNNTELANWLDDIKKKYDACCFTTQKDYNGYTSALFLKGPENDGTVFTIGSSGGASHQYTEDFEWGVAPIPGSVRADGTVNYSAISQGPSFVMFQSNAKNETERQLMTWEFVKILDSPEFQAVYADAAGYNPVRLSTYDIPDYAAELVKPNNIKAVTAKVAQGMSDRFFTSPAFSGSSVARDQMTAAFLHVIRGEADGRKALQDAYNACSIG